MVPIRKIPSLEVAPSSVFRKKERTSCGMESMSSITSTIGASRAAASNTSFTDSLLVYSVICQYTTGPGTLPAMDLTSVVLPLPGWP
ncbi:hypothetical protein D3C75_1056600 [compost metagenome]